MGKSQKVRLSAEKYGGGCSWHEGYPCKPQASLEQLFPEQALAGLCYGLLFCCEDHRSRFYRSAYLGRDRQTIPRWRAERQLRSYQVGWPLLSSTYEIG